MRAGAGMVEICQGLDGTRAELAAARGATRDAVVQMHDALPTDVEMATAEREVKDGVADTSAEYRAAGMDGFVAKPIDVEKLFAAIEAALDQPGDAEAVA